MNVRASRAYPPSSRSSVEVGGRTAVHAHVVRRVTIAAALASLALAGPPSPRATSTSSATSCRATAAVPADRVDPNIKNPWGLVSSPTSPWWPANNGTNTSTIIPATGAINNTVVSVPGGPTGIVWNGTAGAFPITGGQSNFIFNTMSGAISGWRAGTVSEVKVAGARRLLHGPRARGHADRPAALRRRLQAQQGRGLQRAVGAGQQRQVRRSDAARGLRAPTGSRRSATASSSPTPSRTRPAAVRSPARARATSAPSTSPATSSRASRPPAC